MFFDPIHALPPNRRSCEFVGFLQRPDTGRSGGLAVLHPSPTIDQPIAGAKPSALLLPDQTVLNRPHPDTRIQDEAPAEFSRGDGTTVQRQIRVVSQAGSGGSIERCIDDMCNISLTGTKSPCGISREHPRLAAWIGSPIAKSCINIGTAADLSGDKRLNLGELVNR
jgi:hypothetical protein